MLNSRKTNIAVTPIGNGKWRLNGDRLIIHG